MKFTKMQGLGNDYVYVDTFANKVEDPSSLARKVSDRHFGIGSDGLVLIMPSDECDFRMRMFNPDGSEAEMCGNAIRCVSKYVYDKKFTDKTEIMVETLAGVKVIRMLLGTDGKVAKATVDMGAPILDADKVPVTAATGKVIAQKAAFDGKEFEITCVSMGNPHCVIFMPSGSVDNMDIASIGPRIETDPMFPRKTNVEFVEVVNEKELKMRVWERGTGETLACGTGACATLVAAVLNGKSGRKADIHLRGGILTIEWDEKTGHVFMTGPAVTVFEGELL